MSLNWSARPFQLVAGLDRDALGEIAAADAGGPLPQRLDRDHHPPRQEHPRHEGEAEAAEQHQADRRINS